ncbi:MAG: hypothetical protein AAGA60_02085 [Cyanobacteria bacterium P01_E01_bin.42]
MLPNLFSIAQFNSKTPTAFTFNITQETKTVIRSCIFLLLLFNSLSLGVRYLCNTPAEQAKLERYAMLEDPIALRIVMKGQNQRQKD